MGQSECRWSPDDVHVGCLEAPTAPLGGFAYPGSTPAGEKGQMALVSGVA